MRVGRGGGRGDGRGRGGGRWVQWIGGEWLETGDVGVVWGEASGKEGVFAAGW